MIEKIKKKINRHHLNIQSIQAESSNYNLSIKRNIESTYIKILLNYLQTISICSDLRLNWSSVLMKVFTFQNSLAGFFLKTISIDCLLKSKKSFLTFICIKNEIVNQVDTPYVFVQTIIMAIFPFLFVLFFSLFYITKRIIKREKFHLQNFLLYSLTIVCVGIYSLNSNILNSLFELIDCQTFNDNLFLRIHLTVDCRSENYKNWVYYLFLPCFIFYTFFIPLAAIIYLYFIRTKMFNEKYQIMEFLINGFSVSKFYW